LPVLYVIQLAVQLHLLNGEPIRESLKCDRTSRKSFGNWKRTNVSSGLIASLLPCSDSGGLPTSRRTTLRFAWPSRSHRRLREPVRAKRARAAGLPQRLKRCVAMWCDAQRRVEQRCDAPRRVGVAYRDVDKSYASHRRPQHGALGDNQGLDAPFNQEALRIHRQKRAPQCRA
jgi:hypothetical protein